MASVVFFDMGEEGHFKRLRALIAGLAGRGLRVHVFTHARFAGEVASAGGRFFDLFAGRPLERADPGSAPLGCRLVTFAGRYAAAIVREAAALRPTLVVHDSFALIGRVVATALALPRVNVCAGHNVDADRFREGLLTDPRVRVSERCRRAVAVLRDRYGQQDASPFSYVGRPSPFLNVYCEPAEFLTRAERRRFEPIAFFGSLPPKAELRASRARRPGSCFGRGARGLKLYASFGTVIWRYWAREALAALAAIQQAVAALPSARAVLSLGRASLEPHSFRALAGPRLRVFDYVDQWAVLREADVFVTHHGLNSTHEAIFHGVPMLSLPFFWDQPALAAKCQGLGLALALAPSAHAPLSPAAVLAALDAVARRRDSMAEKLARAKAWELRTLEEREGVLDRIAALAGATQGR